MFNNTLLAQAKNLEWETRNDFTGWNTNSTKTYGDIDVFGTYPNLSAAAIMLAPILNWSLSVRANEAQIVVDYRGTEVKEEQTRSR
jgi:hypothetical protein